MKSEILIIDDEPAIRKMLEINLEANGYKVIQADTAAQGIQLSASHQPDLILLDIGLPDQNGLDTLLHLRQWYTNPIIILSVFNQESFIIKALDTGANDYLTKPFRVGELLARIRALLKGKQTIDQKSEIMSGDLKIDLVARAVFKNNQLIKLTSTEYKLLSLLAKFEGRVLTHTNLLKEIWGVGHQLETQYLRVFIGTLRKKIEDDPNHPLHIHTESGIGYRFT
ncbi:MAG: response regulator transcription factor [Saprospiraceae bacterium]|nr:response regulator transcription factor [Saprospiraceae bacterium]